jgi:serine/threonine protein phosphatase PrpC
MGMEHGQSAEVMVMVAARTDVGRVRKNNEDAFSVTDLESGTVLELGDATSERPLGERGILLVLSDGMGGRQSEEMASGIVVKALPSAVLNDVSSIAPDAKLVSAARSTNQEVIAAANTTTTTGMGATMTVVLLAGSHAYVAQVGDSRAYVLREDKFRQLTHDQSLAQLLVDAGALSPEQARHSSRKNVILQAIGQAADIRVATAILEMRRGDRFLLCCDGLSNHVNDDELRDILGTQGPAEASRKLVDLANERGGTDNITVIVAHLAGGGLQLPIPGESVTATFKIVQDFGPAHASV